MDKATAAQFLGVSTRTLERFAATGRLSKGRAKGKTRPVVVFEKSELESLKKELQATKPEEVFRRLNTEKPKDAIGFRLDPSYINRLAHDGEKVGMSAAEFARRLVIRGLEEESGSRVSTELKELRRTLAEMFYLILVTRLGANEAEASEVIRSLRGDA